jgi:hypothetical protein
LFRGLAYHHNLKALEFLLTKILPEDPLATAAPAVLGDIENFRKNSEKCLETGEFFSHCALAGRLDIFKESELLGFDWRRQENFIGALIGERVES